ncbi:hypothetical protein KRMM14A1004_48330 [Krasilnikovia sp. MM14-A1004]
MATFPAVVAVGDGLSCGPGAVSARRYRSNDQSALEIRTRMWTGVHPDDRADIDRAAEAATVHRTVPA